MSQFVFVICVDNLIFGRRVVRFCGVFILNFFHGKHSFICVFSISRKVSHEVQGF